jgi:hypothetical protein
MFELHTIEKNTINNAKIYEKNEIYLKNLLSFFTSGTKVIILIFLLFPLLQ